jgi:hypothetical protein
VTNRDNPPPIGYVAGQVGGRDMTDEEVAKRLSRAQRKVERLERRDRDPRRLERAQRRVAKWERVVSLPAERRPRPIRITPQLVQGVLAVVGAALAATPAGPIVAGVAATVARAGKVAKAVAGQDPDGLSSSVVSEVEASLKAAGLSGAALAAALAAVEDALEDAVDGEADA